MIKFRKDASSRTGLLNANLRLWSSPPIIFARIDRPMPFNFVADSFHTRKVCSRLSSTKCDFTRRTVLRPPLGGGGLEAMYNDHLRLIGKRVVVHFLLVLTELFR